MNGRSCSMSHRTTGIPHGPRMISGQQIPPIRVHAEMPCPSSNSSTPSPAIGNLSASLHLKMPLGGGVAPQSNITDSTIHFPALSPRKQVVTNGKPLLQVPQPPGLPAPQSLRPKQQEFGNTFSPGTGEGKTHFSIAISNSISSPISHTLMVLVLVDGIQSLLYHSFTTKEEILKQNVLLFSTKVINCLIIPRGFVLHSSCSESLNCPKILYKQCSSALLC